MSPRTGITPMLLASASVPTGIQRRASRLLTAWWQGAPLSHRLKASQGGWLKINVGPRWRMLSRDNGGSWALMTHERYNTEWKK